jgi:hypothetical protein
MQRTDRGNDDVGHAARLRVAPMSTRLLPSNIEREPQRIR